MSNHLTQLSAAAIEGSQLMGPREKPTREEIARRTIDRLKKFSDHLQTGRPVSEAYSCRKVILNVESEPYTKEMVKRVRGLLNVSQALFAQFLNVSLSTVQKWERGSPPDGAACRLLDAISQDPDYWRKKFAAMATTVKAKAATT